jgi:hypothetical protein
VIRLFEGNFLGSLREVAQESPISHRLPWPRTQPAKPTSEDLNRRNLEQRAVEAAIWGMPIVSFDAMRQAFSRDAKASYNDIMFWSKPGSWKDQCLTPNTTVRYVFSFINTRQAGPVVVEVPATGDATLVGTLMDAWQVPLADIGIAGEDKGKGGKYLLLPPDFKGAEPAGYYPLRMKTYNGFVGARVIIKSEDEVSVRNAVAYVKRFRIYPFSAAAAPPKSNYIDMADTLWDAVARFDESFYTSLARMVNEEPTRAGDVGMTGTLRTLGIEKGTEFKPDAPTEAALKSAAQESHAWFMDRLVTFGQRYWPD